MQQTEFPPETQSQAPRTHSLRQTGACGFLGVRVNAGSAVEPGAVCHAAGSGDSSLVQEGRGVHRQGRLARASSLSHPHPCFPDFTGEAHRGGGPANWGAVLPAVLLATEASGSRNIPRELIQERG